MTEEKKDKLKPLRDTLAILDHLQWYTPERMAVVHTHKLRQLVAHHVNTSPFFQARVKAAGLKPADIDAAHMERIPVLSRQDIISAGDSFFSTDVPKHHGSVGEVKSSGSTGEPVKIRATGLVSTYYHAYNTLEIALNRRDTKSRFAVVKAGKFKTELLEKWTHPLFSDTGPMQILNIYTDIKEQARILEDFKPDVISIYPSNLEALMDYWDEHGGAPAFKHIKTVGETVPDRLRKRVKQKFNLRIEDVYSSQELGSIAIPCDQGLYHTSDQNLIVEILDEAGAPVGEGETGRVVVTDLHNFASPMIRYDTGDWAVRGGKCSCGRGLKTIQKVMGRTRNLLKRPNGETHWPQVGMYEFDQLSFRIRRYQLIQHTLTDIEYKVQVDELLSDSQKAELIKIAQAALGDEFTITVSDQTDTWPQAPNGKHEEFICRA
jgi:phenylacetate-CoA ligase